MLKKVSAILFACAVGGCQTHTWAPGPNAQGTYEEAQGRCSIMARHSGGSYYARGNATFVASAMAGAAIGEMIRAQSDFNDCMQANGWVAVDQQQKVDPQVAALRQRAIDIASQLKVCIEAAKTKSDTCPSLRYKCWALHAGANVKSGKAFTSRCATPCFIWR
jgi:hypothetical protein